MAIKVYSLVGLLWFYLATVFAEKLSTGEDVAAYVTRKIEKADVMVFAKSYCPYCKASRRLLQKVHDEFEKSWTLDIVDLDQLDEEDGPFIQMELLVSNHVRGK